VAIPLCHPPGLAARVAHPQLLSDGSEVATEVIDSNTTVSKKSLKIKM